MNEWKTSACKRCGADMIWTVTKKGKKLCLDAEPVSRASVPDGALLFEIQPGDSGGSPRSVLTHADDGHVSHWGTCPEREQFKGTR